MATVVAVHGTYAHAETPQTPAPASSDPQWWQPDSILEKNIRDYVDAPDGKLDLQRFVWSGNNSELDRRTAGRQLFSTLRELESRGEPYCIVAHSHGGSVVSWALLEAAARKNPLENLRRWITIGTPFIELKKERMLFDRLGLIPKVILVASLMLFLMFFFNLAASLISGEQMPFGRNFEGILIVTGVMMCLPAAIVYLLLKFIDARQLLLYRDRIRTRARQTFGPRWIPLTHTDDEAVQGLAYLPDAKLEFFDRSFAVPTITLASIIALPLIYIMVLLSPAAMVKIGDFMKETIYDARTTPELEAKLRALQMRLRSGRQSFVRRDAAASPEQRDPAARRAALSEYRTERRALEEQYPNFDAAQRALRFKQRFFEKDGQPCEGGQLCGGGHNLSINSGLLLHLATDELSWSLGADDLGTRWQRWIWALAVPAALVPIASGLLALLLMLIIRSIAKIVSGSSSTILNNLTNAEVKRAAFGNDTQGEIAIGASDRPVWIERSPPRLPTPLADIITDFSNRAASQSLAKFRRAIGQLASAHPPHTADTALTTYFTWKELVHGSYFDVPEFRKLVACAISSSEGFAPSARFQNDADFDRTKRWLGEIQGKPGATAHPASDAPTPEDAEAVSAVVASTVKAEP